MGILSWWRGDGSSSDNNNQTQPPPQTPPPNPAAELPGKNAATGIPGMNGAMEIPRPPPEMDALSVFEFGTVAATADKVTLAGYCPVSDSLDPCRWEIYPAAGPDAPQFRIAF